MANGSCPNGQVETVDPRLNTMRNRATTLLILALVTLTVPLAGCTSDDTAWVRLDVDDFADDIDAEVGFLLDVRTTTEWEQDGYIEGATLIPHTELEARADELPEDKDAPLLVYCRSGNRSQQAAQTLLDLGYTDVRELKTGITGWVDSGRPVVHP